MCFSSEQSQHPPSPPPPPPSQNATSISASALIAASQWSTGLCDCCSDVTTCCLTFWCPCIAFGRNAEILEMGATPCELLGLVYFMMSTAGLQWIYGWLYRFKMRQRYMLPEKPCHDCLVHYCCHSCALCQEYRELKHRGFHMPLGWRENMERRNHGAMNMMPPNPLPQMER